MNERRDETSRNEPASSIRSQRATSVLVVVQIRIEIVVEDLAGGLRSGRSERVMSVEERGFGDAVRLGQILSCGRNRKSGKGQRRDYER